MNYVKMGRGGAAQWRPHAPGPSRCALRPQAHVLQRTGTLSQVDCFTPHVVKSNSMPDITNTSLNIIILLLRVAVVLLLYFFLWQVLRFITRDLRSGTMAAGSSALRSPYGQ